MDAVEPLIAADEALFEMSNLPPRRTGLPFVVFVSQKGGARHDVRVKVSQSPRAIPSEMAQVAIRPDVRDLDGKLSSQEMTLLTHWVDLNRQALIDYWNGEIEYTEDLFDRLRPI